ncbi:TRPM8 channel-associated factor homolog [Ctenopharyngodon idella]|uniref:TRPM8 channel-associated factor homolog n=1 Tax=Ctenopharyngodon idella TaxID=7959 RepID=UPI00222F30EE|nr:TRPM8 channel-associated factor homolog [Ctenopharyngodon idella]
MAREQDYCTLMSGLQELDFQGNAVPSDLVLIGEHAFPLAMNPRGQVLMAASHYGQGRIVVLGHEEYLTRFPGLIKNAIMWLMQCTGDVGIVGIKGSLHSVADNLNCSPIKTELGDFRDGLAIYITDAYSVETCAKDLIAFLKAGGGLIIARQAWSWSYDHPQENTIRNFPRNKVIGKDFKDDLGFLLQGVSEFDTKGRDIASEVMVHGPLAFPIAVTPAGKAFIAGAYYGQGRVILVSHEWYLSRDSLSTLMINAIKWLDEGRTGAIGILPKLKAAHAVLSKSGLDCQLTGFREDLSVYVCSSYSDAQCAEIQEFVAEGGGLHAWHWAQTHPGCNVLTECPGNHILNKMGLSLLGNTLGGGLYKAPEIEHWCREGYHFRSTLQRFVEHVCSNCPVESAKDHLMLHIGTEVYKVSPNPDALLPYIIKDRPDLPTVSNARVRISANTADNTGRANILKRAPVVHERFHLDKEMVQVGNLWGGLIYLIAPPQSKVDGVEIVVQVSVQAPYFKSGETSVADWVSRIRSAPAPWAELEFENIIITLESQFIRNLDRPDEVAKLWDAIMRSIADLAAKPAKFPRKERFVADVQISSGFMHSGYPIMMHSKSAPELINMEEAYKSGLWGAHSRVGS